MNWSKFTVSTLLPLTSEQVILSQKSIRLVKHYLHLVNSCWLLPAGVIWELWHKSRTVEAIDFVCSTPLSPRDTTSELCSGLLYYSTDHSIKLVFKNTSKLFESIMTNLTKCFISYYPTEKQIISFRHVKQRKQGLKGGRSCLKNNLKSAFDLKLLQTNQAKQQTSAGQHFHYPPSPMTFI